MPSNGPQYASLPVDAGDKEGETMDLHELEPAHLRHSTAFAWTDPMRRRRKWLSIATVFLIVSPLLLFLFAPTESIQKAKTKISQTSSDLLNYWPTATDSPASASSLYQKKANDFYKAFGMLQFDRDGPKLSSKARFLPVGVLDELVEQNRTGLEEDYILSDGFDEVQRILSLGNEVDSNALDSLSYLQNKTVLLLGDSIDRRQLSFMCKKMFPGKLGYRQLVTAEGASGTLNFISPKGATTLEEFSEPHSCEFHLADNLGLRKAFRGTEFWTLMTTGLVSSEDTWSFKPDFVGEPRFWKSKIGTFKEDFDKLGKKPDLIIFHSILWDIATFNLDDAIAEVAATERLSLKDVTRFKSETLELLNHLNELWPNAFKMYRRQHGVVADAGTWYLQGLDPMPEAIVRQPYAANKLVQLNNIIDSMLIENTNVQDLPADFETSRFWSFDIRHTTQLYLKDFPDSRHFGEVGSLIYTQMLIYYLKLFFSTD